MSNHTPKTIQLLLTKSYVSIIDETDGDLAAFQWYPHEKDNRVYVWTKFDERYPSGQRKIVQLHRLILARMLNRDLLPTELVDHVDNNPLNNRRENLRLASKITNAQNSKVPSRNKLGIKGVYQATENLYRVVIKLNKKKIHLGYFRTAIEAGAIYNAAAVQYFGEFARLNDIPNWEEIASSADRGDKRRKRI